MTDIFGYCDPAFTRVKDSFAENFAVRGEIGATCSVIIDGQTVVDIWGGHQDKAKTTLWSEDTLSLVFSCTKAATAICAHLLIDQGKLDLDARVIKYWPEFGAAGKDNVTVRMMLGHQSGVPALRDPVRTDGFYDFDYMTKRLAAETPFWEPGTDNGYHMISFGWTVGELIRRVSGQSLGKFFKDNIAGPLGLEFYIGLPDREFERTTKMIPYERAPDEPLSEFYAQLFGDRTSIPHLSLLNSGSHYHDKPEAWRAELGGSGGISNARSLAKMMNALVGKNTILSGARIDDMRRTAAKTDRDRTLLIPSHFGQGFMLSMDNRHISGEGNSLIIPDTAFGHVGAGGSLCIADPEMGLAYGYSMNQMGGGILLNDRGQTLIDATYECL